MKKKRGVEPYWTIYVPFLKSISPFSMPPVGKEKRAEEGKRKKRRRRVHISTVGVIRNVKKVLPKKKRKKGGRETPTSFIFFLLTIFVRISADWGGGRGK